MSLRLRTCVAKWAQLQRLHLLAAPLDALRRVTEPTSAPVWEYRTLSPYPVASPPTQYTVSKLVKQTHATHDTLAGGT